MVEPWMEQERAVWQAKYETIPPPWTAFPDTHPSDIHWRMGGGEAFIMMWWAWWESRQLNESARLNYFRQWPPPARWLEWTIDAVWEVFPEDPEEEPDYGPYFAQMESLGFGTQA